MDLPRFQPYWPFLLPLLLLQWALLGAALADLFRRRHTRDPKWLWFLVVLLIGTLGPVIYLLVGRVEEDDDPR